MVINETFLDLVLNVRESSAAIRISLSDLSANESAALESGSAEISNNSSLTEDEQFEEFLSEIRDGAFVEMIIYIVCFVIGSIGNLWAFYELSRKVNKNRVNYLIRHLAFADLMVVFVAIFTEIVWRISITWEAGLFLCKAVNVARAFTLYLSSNIIVCISFDRYYAFVRPFSHINSVERNNAFLLVAYAVSLLLSLPQAFVFRVEQHRVFTKFKQCTAADFFESQSVERIYNLGSVAAMYLIPLVLIVFCYAAIVIKVSGNFDAQAPSDCASESRATTMERARKNTLKMTISIVVTFILCWTPYAIMVFWYQLHRESAENVPAWLTSGFFIFAYSSSVINPFIHSRHLLNFRNCCNTRYRASSSSLDSRRPRSTTAINGSPNTITAVTQV